MIRFIILYSVSHSCLNFCFYKIAPNFCPKATCLFMWHFLRKGQFAGLRKVREQSSSWGCRDVGTIPLTSLMEHGSVRPFIRIILAVRLTETNNTEPSDHNYSMFQFNIELSWQKKPKFIYYRRTNYQRTVFLPPFWSWKSHFYLAMRATRMSSHLQRKGNTLLPFPLFISPCTATFSPHPWASYLNAYF